ncbi:hypothetical protein HHK36_001289 [Tetracentron sinense]|uniref:Uncharacterized protein n=1 Tax=Tetracentron sinense TaxID=13715 RepID=A0A835DRI1_TETSI|nr:hypothetical protein HHK36_001289 [Tetracentron sinense]
MARTQETSQLLSFSGDMDIRSSLSELILTGGSNALDSIFSHYPPSNATTTHQPEPLGSSVYLRQRELLQKFSNESRDVSKLGFGDCAKLRSLRTSVDSKIQAICQKVKREKASKSGNGGRSRSSYSSNGSEIGNGGKVELLQPLPLSFLPKNEGCEEILSPSVPDSPPSVSCSIVAEDLEFDGCSSLASMPSFDPELIWEVLAT